MRSCTAHDGSSIVEGTVVELEQVRGQGAGAGVRAITGTVRAFGQDGETRWELLTGDPQWPAIGFDPEFVLTVR